MKHLTDRSNQLNKSQSFSIIIRPLPAKEIQKNVSVSSQDGFVLGLGKVQRLNKLKLSMLQSTYGRQMNSLFFACTINVHMPHPCLCATIDVQVPHIHLQSIDHIIQSCYTLPTNVLNKV